MAITKISMPCEPCEPSCESFFINGSQTKPLKNINNYVHVNHVNHLHVRARVGEFSFLCFSAVKNIKNRIFFTRDKSQKSFTSFTFLKNAHKALILKVNLCEPFSVNHSPSIHIVHIF